MVCLPNQNIFVLFFFSSNLWYCVLILFLHIVFALEFSSGVFQLWWLFDPVTSIANLSVKIKVQKNILLNALNSGNCLFSGLCKFICRPSGRLSVIYSEINWLLLSCVNLVCYSKGALFQQELMFSCRGKKCVGMSSEQIMGREERVSVLFASWHYLLFYFAFLPP